MKPIIIAGNGPSLAQIDYSRLPKDFDVFRCNQFYFEDRYFLGKKIKGVFFNPEIFKEQCFTLRHLKERGEYEVEDVYCARAFDDRYYEMDFFFPFVKNTFEALQSLPDFLELDRFYRCYYRKWPTAGIVMLYTALAQGYKEIYLVGIDFYESGQTDYAFEIKNKNIGKIIPNFNKEEISQPHTKEVDLSFIQLAQKMDGITLYSLSPSSPMSKFIPLAP
ncbi:alpha-2,3-sialyltransferase, partial [Helicobacter pametensis]